MAKLNKGQITSILAIAAAMAVTATPYAMVTAAEVQSLIDLKLAEQNPAIKDGDKIATRLTDEGMKAAKDNGYTAPPAFTIATVPLPSIARVNAEGQSKYPFAQLQHGQSFFIPSPAGMKSPSKTFGSLVSGANKKYDGKDGREYRRFTTRSMAGDAYGQPGVKGVGIFRYSAEAEAAEKAKPPKAKKATATA